MKKKKNWKIAGALLAELILFLVLFLGVSIVFKNKNLGSTQYNFGRCRGDSLDVVFVGSSHLYYSMDAPLLMESYGIDSFVLGTSAQTMAMTYYGVQEAIELQHPEIIVVEAFYSFYDDLTVGEGYTHDFLDDMPLCRAKAEAIQALVEPGKRLDYWIPFITYHSRWKEIGKNDFVLMKNDNRGFVASDDITVFPEITPVPEEEMVPVAESARRYIDQIIALCAENDVQLLFYGAPFYAVDSSEGDNGAETQQMYHWLEQYLGEQNVTFVDYFHLLEEIQFDFSSDLKNTGHCNTSGADKVTSYLAEEYLLPMLGEASPASDVNGKTADIPVPSE